MTEYKTLNNQINEALIPQMSRNRQRQFMLRSKDWIIMGAVWKAKKLLGAGGNGLAGWWSRRPSTERPGKLSKAVRNLPVPPPDDIVIKQSARSLENEWNALIRIRDFAKANGGNSDHIVDIYLGVKEAGTGTSPTFDPQPVNAAGAYDPNREVYRIYMEYCEKGDLEDAVVRVKKSKARPIPEEFLWRLFGCLARALMMLETGSEAPMAVAAVAGWIPIVHFDIKPDNILGGDHGTPGSEHARLPYFKLADFGSSLQFVAPGNPAPDEWHNHARLRGTIGFLAPEQTDPSDPPRWNIDTFCNVWQCGAVMHYMMSGKDVQKDVDGQNVQTNSFTTRTEDGGNFTSYANRPPFVTNGFDILGRPYSQHLIDVVHRCLAVNPTERPNAQALWSVISRVLGIFDTMNASGTPVPAPDQRQLHTPDVKDYNDPPTGHPKHDKPDPLPRKNVELHPLPASVPLPVALKFPNQPQNNLIFFPLPSRVPPPEAYGTGRWPWNKIRDSAA